MKLSLLLCFCLFAQGWGRREAMRPWLKGNFSEAEQEFARMKAELPGLPQLYLWEAEFEIERGRFGRAASFIAEAKRIRTDDSEELPERRQGRLLLSIGRFAEARHVVLEGRQWDGKDLKKLKVQSAMDLLTLGEVALARGDYSQAVAILERARDRAKNAASLYGLEWIRAQNDIAIAYLSLRSTQSASGVANIALSAAEREWGANSIPAMDVLDTVGLIQLSELDLKNAEISLSRSRRWREATYGATHPKVADSYLHAGLLSAAKNERTDAIRLVTQGL